MSCIGEQVAQLEDSRSAASVLSAEYMAGAAVPLIASVHTPTDLQRLRRTAFLDVFFDGLSWSKNRHLAAQAVSILLRDEAGKKVLRELARQHGEEYAEAIELTCDPVDLRDTYAAPVTLTADQCAAVDETFGYVRRAA